MADHIRLLADVPFPWHQIQWQRLANQFQNKQLPHALLIYGNKGLVSRYLLVDLHNLYFAKRQKNILLAASAKTALRRVRVLITLMSSMFSQRKVSATL